MTDTGLPWSVVRPPYLRLTLGLPRPRHGWGCVGRVGPESSTGQVVPGARPGPRTPRLPGLDRRLRHT